ncbi:MAG: hypothetical protein HP491_07905 [Nitrospira sp.]|nr:hypothetical protein [Nitrospira sp.]MBH0182903.1 hypothetical protein [Nitrospira sp.]MBH0186210.1 hypothetical protein [Nitrospira sp.]
MRCKCGHEVMRGGKSRTVLDSDGSLGITAWWCRRCNGVTQQVFMLSGQGVARFHKAHYARLGGRA